jgi:hypothetical protein
MIMPSETGAASPFRTGRGAPQDRDGVHQGAAHLMGT